MGWLLDLPTQVRRILQQRNGGTGNDRGAGQYTVWPMRVRTSGEDMVQGNVVHCFEAGKANLADDGDDDVVGVVLGLWRTDGRIDISATAVQNELVAVVTAGICQVLLDEDVVQGEYAFPSATPGTAKGETDPDTGMFGRFLGDGSAGGLAMVKLGGGGGGGGAGGFTDGQVEAHFYPASTGEFLQTRAPYSGTITGWTLIGDDPAGDAVVDVWLTSGGLPTVADSIVAAAPPTLSTDDYATSTSLTGWSTAIAEGDVLIFHIDSASIHQRLAVALHVTRSS